MRIQLISILIIVLSYTSCSFAAPQNNPDSLHSEMQIDTNRHTLSIIIAGDIMQHGSQIKSAYNAEKNIYEYDVCFEYIKPIIENYDVAIANLECTFGGEPYEGYPQFSAPDALAPAIKNAGFDVLMTANNHSCDKRKIGVIRTIKVLDSLNIPHLGTYKDSAERAQNTPMIIRKNGFKVALLNYTYGTNGIPVPKPTKVNLIDTAQIKADLKISRDSMPDVTIVLVHWGLEYKRLPNAKQKRVEDFCYKYGADMVIGSHPHVIQPMNKFVHPYDSSKMALTVYSLGNYISNQRKRYTDGGAMIGIHLSKPKVDTLLQDSAVVEEEYRIDSAGYFLTWVFKQPINGQTKFHIIPADKYAADTVLISKEKDQKALRIFVNDSRKLLAKHNQGIPEFVLADSINWHLSDSLVLIKEPEKKKVVLASDNVYKIQFLASSGEFDKNTLPEDWIQFLSSEDTKRGIKRYMLGAFKEKEEAEKFLEVMKQTGYKDAFIVYYKDGNRKVIK